MPTMEFPYDGTRSLFDMCLDIEAVSNVRVMSAAVYSGVACIYYITSDYDIERETQAIEDFNWNDYPDFRD